MDGSSSGRCSGTTTTIGKKRCFGDVGDMSMTRMHFSLRGYDESELRSLSVAQLRLLCCERELIKPSEKFPQAGTCLLRLLQWKKERSIAPLSESIIEYEDELQQRFDEMTSDQIRKLCEDSLSHDITHTISNSLFFFPPHTPGFY